MRLSLEIASVSAFTKLKTFAPLILFVSVWFLVKFSTYFCPVTRHTCHTSFVRLLVIDVLEQLKRMTHTFNFTIYRAINVCSLKNDHPARDIAKKTRECPPPDIISLETMFWMWFLWLNGFTVHALSLTSLSEKGERKVIDGERNNRVRNKKNLR